MLLLPPVSGLMQKQSGDRDAMASHSFHSGKSRCTSVNTSLAAAAEGALGGGDEDDVVAAAPPGGAVAATADDEEVEDEADAECACVCTTAIACPCIGCAWGGLTSSLGVRGRADEDEDAEDVADTGAPGEHEGLSVFFVPSLPLSPFVASSLVPSARIIRPTASIAEGNIAPTATSATPATTSRVLVQGVLIEGRMDEEGLGTAQGTIA